MYGGCSEASSLEKEGTQYFRVFLYGKYIDGGRQRFSSKLPFCQHDGYVFPPACERGVFDVRMCPGSAGKRRWSGIPGGEEIDEEDIDGYNTIL